MMPTPPTRLAARLARGVDVGGVGRARGGLVVGHPVSSATRASARSRSRRGGASDDAESAASSSGRSGAALAVGDVAKLAALRGTLRRASSDAETETPTTRATPTTRGGDDDSIATSRRGCATRVRATKAGRKGKTATLAGPVLGTDASAMVKELKRALGVGGAVEANDAPMMKTIALQGDVVDEVVTFLRHRGYVAAARG